MKHLVIQLRSTLLLPLLLVACAQGGSDTGDSGGATSSAGAASGGSGGAAVGGGGGGLSVAGAPSAGASTAGNGAGGQAAAGSSAGGSAGAAGGSAGAPSAGNAGNSGSSSAGTGAGGGGPIMQDGIKPYFKTSDTNTTAAISAILGEMHVVNTDGGNATLSLLKVRYYFTNEGTMPTMQMNWAHLKSPGNQVDVPFLASVVKLPTPTATADSYIEFTCNSAYVLDAGKEAEISFRLYDGSNQPVFHQDNDYSFSATATPSDKIVLLYRDVVIWGIAP